MYHGSMRGKGSAFFAVWGYVISNFVPDKEVGAQVDLNIEELAFLIGEKVEIIRSVIELMCGPDPESTNQLEEGKKLVKLGTYSYRVVNGAYYRKIRNEDDRREYQRTKQAEYREKRKGRRKVSLPHPGEGPYVKAYGDGKDPDANDYIHRGTEELKQPEANEVSERLSNEEQTTQAQAPV